MKRLIKLLIGTAFSLVLLSCLLPGTEAAAISGSGTAESPYVITSAAELQAVNDDLDAYYVLGNNISLSGRTFEPLGNEWDGPFTGTLDGRGFTVSYLTVNRTDLKYAGLFGYMEGTVQNLKLDNINISGGRYAGGVAGAIGVGGLITDCEVLSGSVSVSGSPMEMAAGGITGLCEGTVTRCSNGASVRAEAGKIPVSAGGIIGRINSNSRVDNCINSGGVLALGIPQTGGIIGRICDSTVVIANCNNYGDVEAIINGAYKEESKMASGGIVGTDETALSTVYNCINSGTVISRGAYNYSGHNYKYCMYPYCGGIAGSGMNTIDGCKNTGSVSGLGGYYIYGGGIAGGECKTIQNCTNDGNVTVRYSWGSSSSAQRTTYAGGISGRGVEKISCCVNNATIYGSLGYCAGIEGYATGNIDRCVNNGNITSSELETVGPITARTSFEPYLCVNTANVSMGDGRNALSTHITLSKTVSSFYASSIIDKSGVKIVGPTVMYCNGLREQITGKGSEYEELKDPNTYPASWNIGTDWIIDPEWNSGLPLPAGVPYKPLSDSVLFLNVGESADLRAQFEVRQWGSDDTSVATCANGKVTATGVGATVISAWSADGERANCVVYVYDTRDTVNFSQASYGVKANGSLTLTTDIDPDDPQGQIWRSSDTSVATVDSNGRVTAIKTGKVTITVELALSGATGSCEVVVDPADVTRVSLSSLSVNVGDSKQVTVTFTPSNSAAELTWQTGDASVATVENGVVTGHKVGSTTITATTAGGISGSCTVTVKEPSTSVSLDVNELTLEVGMTHMLTTTVEPDGTTDSLTWSTSSSSIASVNSSGLVTANRAGTALITVKTTSGQIATCQVTVRNKTVVPTGISIDRTDARMAIGETLQLSASIEPSNTTMTNAKWTSSDPEVATVSNTGVVRAISSGSAEIRAETENGLYDLCQIKVVVASSAGFVIMDTRAMSGEQAETAVHIVKSPGIAAFSVEVNYDTSALIPVAVAPGECLSSGTLTSNVDTLSDGEPLHITWYSAEDVQENGVAFIITWSTSGSTKEVPITLVYEPDNICNSKQEEVGFSVQDGVVHIIDRAIGDIYYDGSINMKDIVYFARWFNGQETLDDAQRLAADVFYDNELNVKDLSALAQLLNSELNMTATNGIGLMSVSDIFNIQVSDAEVDDNGYATFTVTGSDCPGVAAFRFGVIAPDGYTVTEISAGEDLIAPENLSFNPETGIVSWYSSETCELNGELFEVTIRTVEQMPKYGEISLSYISDDFFEAENYTPVSISVSSGSLTGRLTVEITDLEVSDDGVLYKVQSNKASQPIITAVAFYDAGRMVYHTIMGTYTAQEGHLSGYVSLSDLDRPWDTVKVFALEAGTYKPLSPAAYYGDV